MPFFGFSQQKVEKQQPIINKENTEVVNKLSFSSNKDNVIWSEAEFRKFYQIPDDFPHFNITGDPKTDEENYIKAKEQWLMLHQVPSGQNKTVEE